jgi:radical SAM superfamily enzyme YgiQ (UPF0313 family)
MKISLIYPPVSVAERYGVDIGDVGGRQAPLGLLYLASFVMKGGHQAEIIDAEALFLNLETVLEKLKLSKPDCVGISVTTVAFKNAVRLAELVKKEIPGIKIIAGGPHITANKLDAFQNNCFDIGVYGEGEITLLELLDKKFEQDSLAEITGIIYRTRENRLCMNPPRDYIENLDILPNPARELLPDISIYRPPLGCYRKNFAVSIITSRGCPYNCIFCDNNTFGRKIRYFSPDYVVNEIKNVMTDYHASEITFVDDTLPSNHKRFEQILKMIIDEKLKFAWNCMANLNDLNSEILTLMRKAGCWQIAVGIESGDDNVLEIIGKRLTAEKIREKVFLIHNAGIEVKGFFMLGNPGETPESIKKTTALALGLPLKGATCTIATPIKGTELYRMAASGKFGTFRQDADSSKFNYWEPVFTPSALTANELYEAQRTFFKKFYLRPSILFHYASMISNFTILKRCISTSFKIIKSKRKKDMPACFKPI